MVAPLKRQVRQSASPEKLADQQQGGEQLYRGGHSKEQGKLEKQRGPAHSHSSKVHPEKECGTIFTDQILNAWCRHASHQGSEAFEPGEERYDLVEHCQAQAA